MSQVTLPIGLKEDDSNTYQPRLIVRSYKMEDLFFGEADADVKVLIPYPFPSILPLEVRGELFSILLIPQTDGGTVARIATDRFNATGQGETEKEALRDIKSAIELLMEEESNPSGDVPWPENCQ